MAMCLAVVLPLLFGCLAFGSAAINRCCYPPRMEGTFSVLEERLTVNVAFDFTTQRLIRGRSFDSGEFEILDLATGDLYAFNGTECRLIEILPPRASFEQCLEYSDIFVGQDVNLYNVRYMEGSSSLTQLSQRRGAHCLPIVIAAVTQAGATRTMVFGGMQAGVSTDKINTSVDSCQRL